MIDWSKIPKEHIKPEHFIAVIEIPKGSKQKYEVDPELGLLHLDRILYTSTHYPANYGFIPRTLSEDGDELDVLVLSSESLQPLCLVDCYPIGGFYMDDQKRLDEKIIAVPFRDPQFNAWHDMRDLPPHTMSEIEHFFAVYKELEGKETDVQEMFDAVEARKVIQRALNQYELIETARLKTEMTKRLQTSEEGKA